MHATEDTAMSSDAPSPQTPTDTSREADRDGDDADDILGGGRPLAEIPAGRRTSGNVELLVIEAELVADGKQLDNPARPDGPDVVDELMSKLEPRGLRPAYKVVGDE
jgi:hypothetical protein